MALTGVRRFFLDEFFEYCPGKIPKTETTVLCRVEIEILCIHGLALGNLDVNLAEVGG